VCYKDTCLVAVAKPGYRFRGGCCSIAPPPASFFLFIFNLQPRRAPMVASAVGGSSASRPQLASPMLGCPPTLRHNSFCTLHQSEKKANPSFHKCTRDFCFDVTSHTTPTDVCRIVSRHDTCNTKIAYYKSYYSNGLLSCRTMS
jgi:hypothetical protein